MVVPSQLLGKLYAATLQTEVVEAIYYLSTHKLICFEIVPPGIVKHPRLQCLTKDGGHLIYDGKTLNMLWNK